MLINFFYYSESQLTVPHGDMYDLPKICKLVRKVFPEEIVTAECAKFDFKELQERHISTWSRSAYVQKQPVRSIGLQVSHVFTLAED